MTTNPISIILLTYLSICLVDAFLLGISSKLYEIKKDTDVCIILCCLPLLNLFTLVGLLAAGVLNIVDAYNSRRSNHDISKVVGIFVTALLLVPLSCEKEGVSYPGVGDPLPSFKITTNRGVQLSELHLSATDCVLAFFSTSCPDCHRELPVVDTFYRKHPNKMIIAISREEKEQDIVKMWNELEMTMPYSVQKDRNVYNKFTESGVPYIVISRKGIITAIFTDQDNLTSDMLEKEFK